MAAPKIERDDVPDGVVTRVDLEARLDAGFQTRAETVAAIQDLVLVKNDRLPQPFLAHVINQAGQVFGLHLWKDGGEGVVFVGNRPTVAWYCIGREVESV